MYTAIHIRVLDQETELHTGVKTANCYISNQNFYTHLHSKSQKKKAHDEENHSCMPRRNINGKQAL